jgi:hypothetical protein
MGTLTVHVLDNDQNPVSESKSSCNFPWQPVTDSICWAYHQS